MEVGVEISLYAYKHRLSEALDRGMSVSFANYVHRGSADKTFDFDFIQASVCKPLSLLTGTDYNNVYQFQNAIILNQKHYCAILCLRGIKHHVHFLPKVIFKQLHYKSILFIYLEVFNINSKSLKKTNLLVYIYPCMFRGILQYMNIFFYASIYILSKGIISMCTFLPLHI